MVTSPASGISKASFSPVNWNGDRSMTALDRKLFRDLMQMKGQAIAICAVIASGVATFVMALSTLESLQVSQYTYYERYRFADVFAHMKRAPRSLARQFEQIPGVAQVEPRIVADVSLDVPGMSEPAVGRIISVPEFGTWGLNQVHLRSRVIEAGARDEVMISEVAEANGLRRSSLLAVINGRRERLGLSVLSFHRTIAEMRGIESLPIEAVRDLLVHEKELKRSRYGQRVQRVVISLMPGAVEEEVLERIDRLIETYGGAGSYGREDQLSHRWVSDEIKQLKGMGIIAPSIFLSVAAFLLNVVFTRLVNTQREQIAALKAFGYTRFEIGLHFLKFVLALMLVGLVVGTALGAWMGKGLTGMYTVFYKFPVFYFEFNLKLAGLAMGLSSAAALVGTFGAVRRAIVLPPAQAMRPEPPATYKPTVRGSVSRIFFRRWRGWCCVDLNVRR
jgi:putative ABC transport system permease protein